LTLLETIGDEKRQCGVTTARCIVTQPQTCCSGQCCCELDDDCNLCTLPQEEGRSPGVSTYLYLRDWAWLTLDRCVFEWDMDCI
jgi:hypothetical protein